MGPLMLIVRLQIVANQLRVGFQPGANALRLVKSSLVGNEGFPSRHHTGRSVPSCSEPALVIANDKDAGELALWMLLVGSYQRQRTICSSTQQSTGTGTVFHGESPMRQRFGQQRNQADCRTIFLIVYLK
jgi:hypothetical protein